jgi:hypothetical protein
VYSNSSVDPLVGMLPLYVGMVPYSTSPVSNTVSSSSFHVAVYLFVMYLYVALYSADHVTSEISGSHHANSYEYFSSAG